MAHRWQARPVKTTASEVKMRICAAPNVGWRQVDFQAMSYFIRVVDLLRRSWPYV
jgi:hypothetical protein